MTSTDFTLAPKANKPISSTKSFGSHRQSDRPASAIRAGASSMPTAWQSNGAAVGENRYQHGAPVRSIGDIMTDPFRWVMASTPRKLATGALFGAAILTFIF